MVSTLLSSELSGVQDEITRMKISTKIWKYSYAYTCSQFKGKSTYTKTFMFLYVFVVQLTIILYITRQLTEPRSKNPSKKIELDRSLASRSCDSYWKKMGS